MENIRFRGDKVILLIVMFLAILSVIMLASAGDKWVPQLRNFGVGFFALFVFYHIDYRTISRFSLLALGLATVLLIYTLIYGSSTGRAATFFGVDLQTFYMIGFCVVFFLAKYLGKKINGQNELTQHNILLIFSIVAIFCAGIFKTNFSTSLILFCTCIAVIFCARVKSKYLLYFFAVVLIAVSLAFAAGLGKSTTAISRIKYWYYEEAVYNKDPYYGAQSVLSKAAISTADWLPTKVGKGKISSAIPKNENDYIYAVVVEEMGLIVGILVLFAYFIILFRTMRIARQADGAFGMLLAWGIGIWFCMQAFIHIGVNTFLIPATGQTLPFISHGGMSLLVSGAAIGMLLNISKDKNLA